MATTTNNGWETPDDTDLVKDGALSIRTLGSAIDTSAGKTWLPWTAFTPTWSGLTVGNGTYNTSHYVLIGKTVHMAIDFTLGSTSAVTGEVTLTVPANLARKNIYNTGVMYGMLQDTGTAQYVGQPIVSILNAQNFLMRGILISGTTLLAVGLTSTFPFTWTNTDRLVFSATYEVA